MLTFTLDIDYAHTSVLREISNIRLIIDSLEEKFKEELRLEEEEELLKKLRGGRKFKKRHVGLLELPDIKEEDEEEDEVQETTIAETIAEEKAEKEKTKEKKITCPCGGEFVARNKKRHEKTKTHEEYLKINNIK